MTIAGYSVQGCRLCRLQLNKRSHDVVLHMTLVFTGRSTLHGSIRCDGLEDVRRRILRCAVQKAGRKYRLGTVRSRATSYASHVHCISSYRLTHVYSNARWHGMVEKLRCRWALGNQKPKFEMTSPPPAVDCTRNQPTWTAEKAQKGKGQQKRRRITAVP